MVKPSEAPPKKFRWWQTWTSIRRVGVFLLGAAVIIDALSRGDDPWPELLIGALMVGAFPLSDLTSGGRVSVSLGVEDSQESSHDPQS